MGKFVSGVFKMAVMEFHMTMLIKDIDISRSMIHSQQIKEEKSRESKRTKTSDG